MEKIWKMAFNVCFPLRYVVDVTVDHVVHIGQASYVLPQRMRKGMHLIMRNRQ
jgi:hypothetical protein